MISVEEAKRIILESIEPLSIERVLLADCHLRITAEDIRSRDDIPPFDNSSMDGYAVRSVDSQLAKSASPIALRLLGEIPAGNVPGESLEQGTAVYVTTGAPLPKGADSVVEQELVSAQNGCVHITSPVKEGKNIRRRGEDVRAGQIVVEKGTRLSASHLGALASVGASSLNVFKKPNVAFLVSGNEVVNVDSELQPGKIRNSNAYSLLGLIREAQCLPVDLGISPDNEEYLTQKIKEGLRSDALITSGGISVGKYDLILKSLEKVGVACKFWKVNIKPGGPFAFSVFVRDGKTIPVFSLPGNPVSTVVTFLQFVRPGLEKLMGMASVGRPLQLRALLEEDLHKTDNKTHFSRGILRNEAGRLVVTTTGSQSSGVLTSLTKANCLILIPEEKKDVRAGEEVDVEIL